jgi:hypothetical protein
MTPSGLTYRAIVWEPTAISHTRETLECYRDRF